MLEGLNSLNDITLDNYNKPSNIESIYYLFWRKGISLKEFSELPLPYIFGILRTHKYVKDKEEQEIKKANRKR